MQAENDDGSHYSFVVSGDTQMGEKADAPGSATYPDSAWDGGGEGFVGDSGMDTYTFTGDLEKVRWDGSARLKVWVDGELWATVEDVED